MVTVVEGRKSDPPQFPAMAPPLSSSVHRSVKRSNTTTVNGRFRMKSPTAELAVIATLQTAPEVRETAKGRVVTLALLVSDLGKADGQLADAWVRTTAFGAVADRAAELRKGDLVYARGRPTLDKWRDRITQAEKSGLSMIAIEIARVGVFRRPPPETDTRPRDKPIELVGGLPQGTPTFEAIRVRRDPPRQYEAPLSWSRLRQPK
jgi:hypothetical protein